jgi:hypothetical protein
MKTRRAGGKGIKFTCCTDQINDIHAHYVHTSHITSIQHPGNTKAAFRPTDKEDNNRFASYPMIILLPVEISKNPI